MTTGNIVRDLRVGTYLAGLYFAKSWTGTDYPAVMPIVQNAPFYMKGVKRTFRRLPKRAYITPHPYSMELEDTNNVTISSGTYTGMTPIYIWGTAATGAYSVSNWTGNDDLALNSKLRGEVAGSDFNAGVFLGEGHQVLNMIGDSAKKLARAYLAAKKGNFQRASRILTGNSVGPSKKAANNWLELQYGWLPLLSDIHGGAQFLAHHLNTPLQHKVVVKRTLKRAKSETNPASGYPDRSFSVETKSIVAFIREKNVPQLAGLTDPLSVAWELVPYSFVVDWFIPIGEWLASRGLSQALEGTFVTTRVWKRGGMGYTRNSKAPLYRHIKVSMTRTVSTTLSFPFPNVKPLWKAASWRHAANAAALLAQVR